MFNLKISLLMSVAAGLGVAGLASNVLGLFGQQDNFDEQMEFAKYQYEDMKHRQDPVTQVSRLRAAGINPALAYGNVNLGQANGVSQPSAPGLQGFDLAGLSALGNSIDLNDTMVKNTQSQTEKNIAETQGINTDNLFKAENWKSLIYGRDMKSWLDEKLSQAAQLDVEYNTNVMKYRVEQQRQQMALLQSQVAAQDLANHYFPIEKSEQISKLLSEQFANYATGKASLRQVHLNMMRLFAEVGKDENERSQFFNATLDNLRQQKAESQGREWHIVHTVNPLPKNKGNWENYNEWKHGSYTERWSNNSRYLPW